MKYSDKKNFNKEDVMLSALTGVKTEEQKSEIEIKTEIKYEKARDNFWEYEKLMNHKFFRDDRPHLKELAETLQALYERRIRKLHYDDEWKIYSYGEIEEIIASCEVETPIEFIICSNLMINMPPRHGKSYTLTLFEQWVFGKSIENRIITVTYNETLSTRFSSGVRDGIDATKINKNFVIFSDVFPNVKIKYGDGAKQLWALEGSFFNYLGTGFGGTMTGVGCNIGIVDDPVKNREEACNEAALEGQWSWYTDTFLSRIEEGGLQIINMTRWSSKDLCGKLLESDEASEWYVLKMRACLDYDSKEMLCPSLLSFKTYCKKKRRTSIEILEANYQQKPVDMQGALYGSGFKTYKSDEIDYSMFDRIINYTDTADQGTDSLCSLSAGDRRGYLYLLDPYFTDAAMEITEPETARRLDHYRVRECAIESNNGGRGFARSVKRNLRRLKNRRCAVTDFYQSKNKRARITSNASGVLEKVIMPEGWEKDYPDFYKALMSWQRRGKNKHDDAPDALTGLYEFSIGEVKGRGKVKVVKRDALGV